MAPHVGILLPILFSVWFSWRPECFLGDHSTFLLSVGDAKYLTTTRPDLYTALRCWEGGELRWVRWHRTLRRVPDQGCPIEPPGALFSQ